MRLSLIVKVNTRKKAAPTPKPLPRSESGKSTPPPADGHATGKRIPTNAFQPGNTLGQAGRPRGAFSPKTLFRRALENFKAKNRVDLFEIFVEQAATNPVVMNSAMNKLLPNKTEISFGDEEIRTVQEKFMKVVVECVKDPVVLESIASGLEKVVDEYEVLLAGTE